MYQFKELDHNGWRDLATELNQLQRFGWMVVQIMQRKKTRNPARKKYVSTVLVKDDPNNETAPGPPVTLQIVQTPEGSIIT
jgi:hypothetical protein